MRTLAGPGRYEEVIRRSRFVAHAARVRSEAETLAFYESVADPQATHNCWAWQLDGRQRCNDDGEPGGTAGRPILAAIEGHGLDRVMVVVTRYFGGVKLGVGGLKRAYGGCAARCLDRARSVEIVPTVNCRIEADFGLSGPLHQLLDRCGGKKLEERFEGEGLRWRVALPRDELAAFGDALAQISRGEARLETG